MNKIITLILCLVALSGCNSSIPVVDLDQSTHQCRSNDSSSPQQAFVYPTAEFGVCMDKALANYLYCVNTISLIHVSSNDSAQANISIGQVRGLFDSINFTNKEKKEIVQSMAANGRLAEARAEAINYCKEFARTK